MFIPPYDNDLGPGMMMSFPPCRVHPPMIVVGTDDPSAVSKIHIFEYSEDNRKWQGIHNIVGVVFDPVHDVAFAPNLGRFGERVGGHYLEYSRLFFQVLSRVSCCIFQRHQYLASCSYRVSDVT